MFDKIFFFNSMITPKLITFIYWIMLLGSVIGALGTGLSTGNFLYGILALIGGFILSRVWCELMIVMFKINENIQKIANRTGNGETDPFA